VVTDALWVASMLGVFVANLFGVREPAEFLIYLCGLSALVSAVILAFRAGSGRVLRWRRG
jgi:hypothetical protein